MRSMSTVPCTWREHPSQSQCGQPPAQHHIRTAWVGIKRLHGYQGQWEQSQPK